MNTRSASLAPMTIVALLLLTGCRTFPPRQAVPTDPPAVYQTNVTVTQDGFEAIYEGELRIWFHTIRTLWMLSVDTEHLSIATLSPSGVTIMQMHGDASAYTGQVRLPPAQRLEPYGESIWQALWHSLAATGADQEVVWRKRGQQINGKAKRETGVRTRFQKDLREPANLKVRIRGPQRRRHTVSMEFSEPTADPRMPERIQIRSRGPRLRLTLSRKNAYVPEPETSYEGKH